ncbi:hypothetical protein SCHPADRAFT_907350 [Schizopora paradoxa]|uniref:DUF6533 domain-containing protein n=1 Tax=Schizopora paradoxa TaxID=27342 RepID=A0A0H2RYV0_9AGAM|nr:hypothetical protein SCHPADRAFT_907350 [Schizopora paradoxa]
MDPASIAEGIKLLRQTYHSMFFLNLARMGFLVLSLYDVILCFPDELESIWKARWSTGKVLYICCRYTSIFYLIFCVVFQFLVDCPLEVSRIFSKLEFCCAIFVYVPFQVLVGIRTYALYNRTRMIKWSIIILFTIYILIAIGMGILFSEKGTYAKLPLQGASCVLELQKYPTASVITLFIAGTTYDLVLWIILVVRVYQAYDQGQTRLMGVIFRLGLLYFTFVTAMYIVCAVLFIKLPSTELLISTAIAHLLQTTASVLSARFILHLRTYLNDLSIQSISVSPERIMRVEDERKFGYQTSTDDSLYSFELAPPR